MANVNDMVISMHIYDPLILTLEEYDRLKNEVIVNFMADPSNPTLRVLARLLKDNESRAETIRMARKEASNG